MDCWKELHPRCYLATQSWGATQVISPCLASASTAHGGLRGAGGLVVCLFPRTEQLSQASSEHK